MVADVKAMHGICPNKSVTDSMCNISVQFLFYTHLKKKKKDLFQESQSKHQCLVPNQGVSLPQAEDLTELQAGSKLLRNKITLQNNTSIYAKHLSLGKKTIKSAVW